VHVAHDRDDGRPRQHVLGPVLFTFKADFHVRFRHPFEGVAEFGDDQFRRVGIDHVIDGGHHAHFHQRPDNVHRTLGHAVRQFLHGDGFRNHHFAEDFLRCAAVAAHQALFLLPRPAQRRQAALTRLFLVPVTQNLMNIELGRAAFFFAFARQRHLGRAGTAAAAAAELFFFFQVFLNGARNTPAVEFFLGGHARFARFFIPLAGFFFGFTARFFLLAAFFLFRLALGFFLAAAARFPGRPFFRFPT